MASHPSAVNCSSRRSGKFIPAATTSTSIPPFSPTSSTTGGGVDLRASVGEEVGGGEPDAAARPYDERRLAGQVRAFHYSVSARKILIRSDGPRTSSAKAPGPSSSGNTG